MVILWGWVFLVSGVPLYSIRGWWWRIDVRTIFMLEGNEGEGGQAGSKGANTISFVGEILSGSIRESFAVRLRGNEEEGGQGCTCPPSGSVVAHMFLYLLLLIYDFRA